MYQHKPRTVVLQGEIDSVSPENLFRGFDNQIKRLFELFNIRPLLNKSGINKSQGYNPIDLLYLWVLHPFF